MTFWYGSGSSDPHSDDLDPALFVRDLQDARKIFLTYYDTFTPIFTDKVT